MIEKNNKLYIYNESKTAYVSMITDNIKKESARMQEAFL